LRQMSERTEIDEKIQLLREAIETEQAVTFYYNRTSRVVEPYVLGLSSEGNPLLRGFQTDGESLSGKGPGWRVYQVVKIEGLELFGEYFSPERFDYDPTVPWIYEVDTQIP